MDLAENPPGRTMRADYIVEVPRGVGFDIIGAGGKEERSDGCPRVDPGQFRVRPQGSIQGFAIAMPVAAKSSTLRVASSAPWLRQIAAI